MNCRLNSIGFPSLDMCTNAQKSREWYNKLLNEFGKNVVRIIFRDDSEFIYRKAKEIWIDEMCVENATHTPIKNDRILILTNARVRAVLLQEELQDAIDENDPISIDSISIDIEKILNAIERMK